MKQADLGIFTRPPSTNPEQDNGIDSFFDQIKQEKRTRKTRLIQMPTIRKEKSGERKPLPFGQTPQGQRRQSTEMAN